MSTIFVLALLVLWVWIGHQGLHLVKPYFTGSQERSQYNGDLLARWWDYGTYVGRKVGNKVGKWLRPPLSRWIAGAAALVAGVSLALFDTMLVGIGCLLITAIALAIGVAICWLLERCGLVLPQAGEP